MGDLRPAAAKATLYIFRKRGQNAVGIKIFRGRNLQRCIEPPKKRLAFRVDFVVYVHHLSFNLFVRLEMMEPPVQIHAVPRRGGQNLRPRKLPRDRRGQFLDLSGRKSIGFADHDNVGFLELLFEDVNHLLGK